MKKSIKLVEPSADTGAPAELQAWSEQGLKDRTHVLQCYATLEKLLLLDRDDAEIKKQIAQAEHALVSAKDQWAQTSKILLSFDKNVSEEQRSGSKWPQRDVEKWLEAIATALRLAQEQVITSYSQDAIKCDSETQVYEIFAPSARRAMREAIETSVKQLKMPEWAAESLLRGL